MGKGYKISKNLGVGTVAETYLATSPDGKEVCLKIIKDGITQEKILKDKEAFIDIIKKLEKTPDEKDYLIRNIEDLSNGIIKEVDLQNEMNAARELAKYTKSAKVVKPIDVKNGVYIMEKADGVSLESFVKMNNLQYYKACYEKRLAKAETKIQIESYQRQLNQINEEINKLSQKMPAFKDLNLSDKDAMYMFEEYVKVLTELFYKIDKNSKILHADIHPGNIFIDVEALKAKKGKVFTLIDTGNTINLSKEQALRSIQLSQYINRGDAVDIAEYMLDGANLAQSGLTKEQAMKKIVEELEKRFYDNKTELGQMTNDKMFDMVTGIMKQNKIIPASNQLNLEKAKHSAANSYDEFVNMWFDKADSKIATALESKGKVATAGATISMGKDLLKILRLYEKSQAKQQKLNTMLLSPAERIKFTDKNSNIPALNSEKYLTYKLKQKIKDKRMVDMMKKSNQ